jgi:hypothetical protein
MTEKEKLDAAIASIHDVLYLDVVNENVTKTNMDLAFRGLKIIKAHAANINGGWLPIKSAPRDENKYLFYTASGQIRTGRRVETLLDDCETIGFKNEAWLSCCEGEEVTHWQPLPPPPAT